MRGEEEMRQRRAAKKRLLFHRAAEMAFSVHIDISHLYNWRETLIKKSCHNHIFTKIFADVICQQTYTNIEFSLKQHSFTERQ